MMNNEKLTYKIIFRFWSPLAATWLMMAAEGPFLAALIARLGEPKYNLAAYGVAFAIALIIEAPIIMIMSASLALTKDKYSFIKIRRFLHTLNFIITSVMLIVIFPPVFRFISLSVLNLPPELARLSHVATILMLPWPAAIGYRRLYQGILIRFGLTRRVTYGTMVRLTTDIIVAGLLVIFTDLPGAYIGTLTLSIAVTLEAIATRIMAAKQVRMICGEGVDFHEDKEKGKRKELTYKFIARFYLPLALSSILGLGIHPVVTFFMGKARFSIESLAILPVLNALVFIFRSFGLAYLEVSLALLGEKNKNYKILRNFAAFIGGTVVTGLTLIALTPLATVWFHKVSGLTMELASFALLPLKIGIILPGLSVLLSFQRSVLLNSNRTTTVTVATAMEVTVVIAALVLTVFHLNIMGAVAAFLALTLGRLFSTGYQHLVLRKVLK